MLVAAIQAKHAATHITTPGARERAVYSPMSCFDECGNHAIRAGDTREISLILAREKMRLASPREFVAAKSRKFRIPNTCFGNPCIIRDLLAGGLGFEPRQAESESAVLPLDDPPAWGRRPLRDRPFRPAANPLQGRVFPPRTGVLAVLACTRPGTGRRGRNCTETVKNR